MIAGVPSLRWDDQRAKAEAALLKNDFMECGAGEASPWMVINADSCVARAVWLASRYAKDLSGAKLLEQLDLPAFLFTGELYLSESVASRKWGFTTHTPWDNAFKKIVRARLGALADTLVPTRLVEAGQTIGPILPQYAEGCNLPYITQFITAPYDTVAGVLGLGILNDRRIATLSLGTSMGVCRLVPRGMKVSVSEFGPLPDIPFPGQGMLYEGLRSCGSAIDLVNTIALAKPTERSITYYTEIENCLRDTRPGSSGVLVFPFFNGGLRMGSAQAPEPAIIGFKKGLEQDLVRAGFESQAYHIRMILEKFAGSFSGPRVEIIRAGGGLTANHEFMKLIASVTGRKVEVSRYPNSGLLGCAICVASGLKWSDSPAAASKQLVVTEKSFDPDPDQHAAYESQFRAYCKKLEVIGGGHHAPK
jgi:sugar (pentulose or hexulose) kinase